MQTLFPPFEPDDPASGRHGAGRRFRTVPVRVLIPNIITLVALCAGLTAIRLAIEGRLELAVGCIVGAAILDGVDGRLARYLEGTSRFGAELDSLADFVNFGVVPALVIYFWGLHDLKSLGWIVALVFTLCMVLRLARFNVMLDDPDRPAFQVDFFVGMPAPLGACTVLLPVYLDLLGFEHTPSHAKYELAYVLLISFLTASRIPTYSGKKLTSHVSREWVLPLFVTVVALLALLIFYPWETLSAVTVLYLLAIPFGVQLYRRLDRRSRMTAEASAGTPSEPVANSLASDTLRS